MAISKEDILQAVSGMSVMDVVDLVKMMETKFGVSAAASVAVAAPAGGTGNVAAEEKTEFEVLLKTVGDNKINVIKAVRTVTGLGLKEAKDLVEGAPASLKAGVSKDEVAKIKKEIESAGATIEVK